MVSWQSTWYCGNKFSAVFLYQCVVRYDQRHVDWSHYFRPSYDRTKLPRLCADGAPSNYTRLVLQHLNDTFPNQWNTCSSTINQPPRSPDLTPLEFCLRSWMKSEVYRRKVGIQDELLNLIMDVITRIKKHQDALRRATHQVLTWDAKCIDVDSGIFENVLY